MRYGGQKKLTDGDMAATSAVCGFRAKKNSGIKLHHLPREPKALRSRFARLSIHNKTFLYRHTRICSQHFNARPRVKLKPIGTKSADCNANVNRKGNYSNIYVENTTKFNNLSLLAEVCDHYDALSRLLILSELSSGMNYLPPATSSLQDGQFNAVLLKVKKLERELGISFCLIFMP